MLMFYVYDYTLILHYFFKFGALSSLPLSEDESWDDQA